MKNKVPEEKVEKYLRFTEEALEKIEVKAGEGTHVREAAEDVLGMVKAYLEDARHFKEKGDLVNAFAALNYAYGWLDCAVRLGIIDGSEGAGKFFTV